MLKKSFVHLFGCLKVVIWLFSDVPPQRGWLYSCFIFSFGWDFVRTNWKESGVTEALTLWMEQKIKFTSLMNPSCCKKYVHLDTLLNGFLFAVRRDVTSNDLQVLHLQLFSGGGDLVIEIFFIYLLLHQSCHWWYSPQLVSPDESHQ